MPAPNVPQLSNKWLIWRSLFMLGSMMLKSTSLKAGQTFWIWLLFWKGNWQLSPNLYTWVREKKEEVILYYVRLSFQNFAFMSSSLLFQSTIFARVTYSFSFGTYSTEKNGTYSISLIKHVLLHNGEKHYACSRCDKTLKHRNDLKNISWNVIWCFRAHLLRQVSHFEFGSFLGKGSWQ